MNEERLLEKLSNNILKKVKKAASSCNLSTAATKIYIIMPGEILTEDSKFKKSFLNICRHSGSWLTYSCPHGVVYYVRFALRSESSPDYVDVLPSVKYISNVVVIDMADRTAKHALILKKR